MASKTKQEIFAEVIEQLQSSTEKCSENIHLLHHLVKTPEKNRSYLMQEVSRIRKILCFIDMNSFADDQAVEQFIKREVKVETNHLSLEIDQQIDFLTDYRAVLINLTNGKDGIKNIRILLTVIEELKKSYSVNFCLLRILRILFSQMPCQYVALLEKSDCDEKLAIRSIEEILPTIILPEMLKTIPCTEKICILNNYRLIIAPISNTNLLLCLKTDRQFSIEDVFLAMVISMSLSNFPNILVEIEKPVGKVQVDIPLHVSESKKTKDFVEFERGVIAIEAEEDSTIRSEVSKQAEQQQFVPVGLTEKSTEEMKKSVEPVLDKEEKEPPVKEVPKKDTEPELVPSSSSLMKEMLKNKKGLLSKISLEDQRFSMGMSIAAHKIKSDLMVPLIDEDGEVMGGIHLKKISGERIFTEQNLIFLNAIAYCMSLGLKNVQTVYQYKKLLHSYQQKLKVHEKNSQLYNKKIEQYEEMLEGYRKEKDLRLFSDLATYTAQTFRTDGQIDNLLDKLYCKEPIADHADQLVFDVINVCSSTKIDGQKYLSELQKVKNTFPCVDRKVAKFEKLLSDNSATPGPIERTVAQFRSLMKLIQVTIGLQFIWIAHSIDIVIESFASYIRSLFNIWKTSKSVHKRIMRKDPYEQCNGIIEDCLVGRKQLSRFFSFCGSPHQDSYRPTFPLEIALQTRGHLDEMKRDLDFVTIEETKQTAKKTIQDFLLGFIPNPFELIRGWKDLLVLVFVMKYSRQDIEQMYIDMVRSYQKLIVLLSNHYKLEGFDEKYILDEYEQEIAWRSADLPSAENISQSVEQNRQHLQRLIQSMYNPGQFIHPKKWSLRDLLYEVQRMKQTNTEYCHGELELEKRLISIVSKSLANKNYTCSLEEKEIRLEEAKDFRERYHMQRKLTNLFI